MDELKNREDADLRAAFAELRAEEREEAPDVRATLSRAVDIPRGRRWIRWGVWPAGLAAAALATVLLVQRGRETRSFEALLAQASQETRLGSWRGPSDFLLDYEGREFYSTLPRIMDVEDGALGNAPEEPDSATDEGRGL